MLHIPGARDFAGKRIAILGVGVSGRAAISALSKHTSAVIGAWDRSEKSLNGVDRSVLDVCHIHDDPQAQLDSLLEWNPDIVIIAPGFSEIGPQWTRIRAKNIPLWSEIELAWHLRACNDDGDYAPWLCVTGTNGKTTTVSMLEAILRADGLRAQAIGNVGTAAVTAVSDTSDSAPQAFACELSSFQLAATYSMEPTAAVVLNVADDHLEWHESRESYANAKARIYERTVRACVFPVGDSQVQAMVDNADVREGARAIGVSLGIPDRGELGLVDEIAVDRAFVSQAHRQAAELFTIDDVAHLAPEGVALPVHIVKDALAAAALARAIGVSQAAVAQGIREYVPHKHRIAVVGTLDGVTYIDDSKATNAHAALASMRGQKAGSTIWIVGGLAKGVQFGELVSQVSDRLAGVVVLGTDQSAWRAALSSVEVPVVYVDSKDPDPMRLAVRQARELAQPGNTVLLAPACASQDQFVSYGDRGDKFAQAVSEMVVTDKEA